MQASQVTAAQVLDAGRRAEADGRVEYAIQFYRHLADHHGAAPEAAAARDALSRLDHRRSAAAPEHQSARAGVARAAPVATRTPAPIPRAPSSAGKSSIKIAPAGSVEPAAPMVISAPTNSYRIGTVIAHILAGLGGLLVLGGLMMTGAAAVVDLNLLLPRWVPGVALHPFAGPTVALSGLILVFWAQIARAVFDIARSSRELVTIERAKIERLNERRR
jgi:hypothetical protein